MHLVIIYVFAFFLGAVVGSFLNVVILRLPAEGESIVFPASRCPKCLLAIQWYDNIPIISFILLNRRCRHCGEPISWQYPLIELVMALLSLALVAKFGFSAALPIYFAFTAALLAVIFIDFHHKIIPDSISLPGVAIGFACSFVNRAVFKDIYLNSTKMSKILYWQRKTGSNWRPFCVPPKALKVWYFAAALFF